MHRDWFIDIAVTPRNATKIDQPPPTTTRDEYDINPPDILNMEYDMSSFLNPGMHWSLMFLKLLGWNHFGYFLLTVNDERYLPLNSQLCDSLC